MNSNLAYIVAPIVNAIGIVLTLVRYWEATAIIVGLLWLFGVTYWFVIAIVLWWLWSVVFAYIGLFTLAALGRGRH